MLSGKTLSRCLACCSSRLEEGFESVNPCHWLVFVLEALWSISHHSIESRIKDTTTDLRVRPQGWYRAPCSTLRPHGPCSNISDRDSSSVKPARSCRVSMCVCPVVAYQQIQRRALAPVHGNHCSSQWIRNHDPVNPAHVFYVGPGILKTHCPINDDVALEFQLSAQFEVFQCSAQVLVAIVWSNQFLGSMKIISGSGQRWND
jgi:hypothetical protein